MSQVSPARGGRRLNRRAAIILGVGVLVVVPGVLISKVYRERHVGGRFLAEAESRLGNDPQLALKYLNQYLAMNPADVEALDLKAKVLADGARNASQALDAMQVHTLVLGRNPENPKRQETRRRLVALNLKVGRPKAAEELARELIRRGGNDPRAHRLLAEALEGIGAAGDPKALREASREYETADRIEPGDVPAAERLALLYRDRLHEPAKALEVLDRLVAAHPRAPAKRAEAHLARARYFASAEQPDRASAEIEAALKDAPDALDVRLASADLANRRGDTASARRHLETLPEEARGTLPVKLAQGQIELNEQRPDEAIRSWRAGLVRTGGTNADLTWLLAQVLIDLGRTAEAEPLLAQYRRLVGGDDPDPRYHYLSGFAQLKKGRPAEAIAELEAIRYKVPKGLEPLLHDLLGQCYERLGNPSKAADAYREATKADPRWSPAWVELANLQGAEHLDDVRRILEQGLAVNPDDPRLLINLGLVLWHQQLQLPANRSWSALEQTLARAAKAAPNSVELALVRADYLTSTGQADDALKTLDAARDRHPRSASLWLARANLLKRLGRTPEAISTLGRAIASGPQAGYFVLLAAIELGQGHVKQARGALLDGLNRVPAEQQPQLWKALGEFQQGQGDPKSAREAFREWARLLPESPEPRQALLALAMASGDPGAIRAEVDALKGIGGPKAPYWRVARVEELLRDLPEGASATAKPASQLDEAAALIKEIEANQPESPAGYLLEGRLLERRGQVNPAIASYEKALDRKGGRGALGPLLALLVRERRDVELARVRKKVAGVPAVFDRLAAVGALKLGDKDRAEELASRMAQGDPDGLDARVWQARVLNELGKPDEAEEALRHLVEAHPDELAPLEQLLRFLVSRKRKAEALAVVDRIRARIKTARPEILWAQRYQLAGDRERADAYFHKALERWPDDLQVRWAAIANDEAAGRRAEAEASLRHLLKLDPALGRASRALALSLAGHEGDRAAWDEALALIGPTPRADDSPSDRLARAGVYAKGPGPIHRQQAIVILEELASELPEAATVLEPLARLLLESGQADRARAVAARAAGEGAAPDAILLYARTLLAAKDLEQAGKQVDRLAKIDPESPAVAELRARILSARGQGRDAVAGLERAFDAQAGSPQALAVGEKMIGLLLRSGQPEAAERVARKVGALGPRGACVLAMFLAGRGQHDDAAPLIEGAARAGALDAAGSAALILAYLPAPDPRWLGLADRFLGQALKGQPDSVDLLQKQARVRYLQGKYDEQVALYQAILDRKPSDFTFLNDMAWTLSEDLGRPADGLKRADEALERAGRQPNILDTRGVILTRLGRLDEAVKDLETAASAMPVGPVYYHLAHAYRAQGKAALAGKARDRARRLGLAPEQLQPSERRAWDEVMAP